MYAWIVGRFIFLSKFFLAFLISIAISIPAYAEYYVVSPYYSDGCCCCERTVYVKKVKHVKHKKKYRCPAAYVSEPVATEMMSEYAWVPDPWDP